MAFCCLLAPDLDSRTSQNPMRGGLGNDFQDTMARLIERSALDAGITDFEPSNSAGLFRWPTDRDGKIRRFKESPWVGEVILRAGQEAIFDAMLVHLRLPFTVTTWLNFTSTPGELC